MSVLTQPSVKSPPVVTEAITISHLSKTYPVPLARLKQFLRRKSSGPVEALRDVSLSIREGEIFGLIGRNGAGKTTLTKVIATLIQPTAGTVNVKGFDSVRDENQVRAQIGLASAEERTFYWRLTVEQNLLFFARLHGMTDARSRTRIAELLARFELEPLARRRFGELSTGNKQRTTVARALLNEPPVLLLDEPTRSLDPLAASQMRAHIHSLAHEQPPKTILLTSHNLAEIEELCERVAVISRGTIRAVGTPPQLRATHQQTERVTLAVRRIDEERARRALAMVEIIAEISVESGELLVRFMRELEDEQLDRAIRTLQAAGAVIISCAVERASLLEVLEKFETDESAGARAAGEVSKSI